MMPESNPDQEAWILAAAEALRRHDSWTGRVHIHKHLFITQVLKLANPPFDFVLYDYGPYSFELDGSIVNLELFGSLGRSYPTPGYGPRYELTGQGRAALQVLPPPDLAAIDRVGASLGKRGSQELELIATCLWFERTEGVADSDEVVRQVQQAKPRYDKEIILKRLAGARELALSLTA